MAADGNRQRAGSRDLGQFDRHAADGSRHPAKQDAGRPLADARDPGDAARPLDDRPGRGVRPSCRLSRFIAVAAAWTWLMLVFGMSSRWRRRTWRGDQSHHGTPLPPTGTLALPFLLPGMLSSVLLGAGSPPFVAWLSLVSYRDVRNACQYSVYPALQWMHIDTREGASLGCRDLPDRHHHPDRVGALPLARRPGQLRPPDRQALQNDGND